MASVWLKRIKMRHHAGGSQDRLCQCRQRDMKKKVLSDIANPKMVAYLEEILRKTEQELFSYLAEAEIVAIADYKLSGADLF